MNYHKITYTDVNNGTGCRVTLWVSGCSHHCRGCHNKETWAFDSGKVFDDAAKGRLFDILSLPYVRGLTLSGGDPMDSYSDVSALVAEIKDKFPDKDIWLYTGYTLEEVCGLDTEGMLDLVDVVVDGVFIEEKCNLSLAFRGSSNQVIWERSQEDGGFVKSPLN